jgi:putative ABC transport system permease protein
MPYEQHLRATGTSLRVLVRTQGPPEALENPVRTTVHARSTSVPMRFSTLEQSQAEYSAAPRFRAILVSGFGLIALCLAVAGIYGVLTCLVGQRTREIGLRMALGATPGTVLRMVLRRTAALAVLGAALGIAGSLTLTSVLTRSLFEVKPTDPVTLAAVTIVLLLAALLAGYLPAQRAAGVRALTTLLLHD